MKPEPMRPMRNVFIVGVLDECNEELKRCFAPLPGGERGLSFSALSAFTSLLHLFTFTAPAPPFPCGPTPAPHPRAAARAARLLRRPAPLVCRAPLRRM